MIRNPSWEILGKEDGAREIDSAMTQNNVCSSTNATQNSLPVLRTSNI